MPSSSSLCAMRTLSSAEKLTFSPCVPSRSVVSKVKTRINLCGGRYPDLFLLFQERHHFAQLGAHLFDGLVFLTLSHAEEFCAAGFVFAQPLFGELARLNLRQNLLHLGARLGVDDARTARIIAVLRRIGNRVAHVAEAALID